jgi:DNA-binding GntR family transcriptional regulator
MTVPAHRHGERPRRVYEQLRALIVNGRLAPGARLVEADIASRFGVSRTPVRGALQRLQQEGYIVGARTLRQTRPTVAPLTRDDAGELFHIVAELEGLAARGAAALAPDERRALVRRLRLVNAEFRDAARVPRPNHERLFELDLRFHQGYVEAGAGLRLRAIHDVIKPQAERYERLYVSLLTHEIAVSVREHEAIARAIQSGSANTAQRAVQTNWRNAAVRLARVIDRAGERGGW